MSSVLLFLHNTHPDTHTALAALAVGGAERVAGTILVLEADNR